MNDDSKGPVLIGQIDFLDIKVGVYYDEYTDKNSPICSWQIRNPGSGYQGVILMDKDSGKCSYPKDVVIPNQTEKDREILPKFIVVGYDQLTSDIIESINIYLHTNYKRKNQ